MLMSGHLTHVLPGTSAGTWKFNISPGSFVTAASTKVVFAVTDAADPSNQARKSSSNMAVMLIGKPTFLVNGM
jgi:hypothetical protein